MATGHAADAPTGRTFDIAEFRVTGNTVLPTRAIEAAVYPFLGQNRSVADVERARSALDQTYMASGYPTVSAEVPEQHAASGVITLHVVERRVGRLRVTGSRYFLLSDIKHDAPSLAEGSVPHMPDVRRDRRRADQDSPGNCPAIYGSGLREVCVRELGQMSRPENAAVPDGGHV